MKLRGNVPVSSLYIIYMSNYKSEEENTIFDDFGRYASGCAFQVGLALIDYLNYSSWRDMLKLKRDIWKER